MDWQPNDLPPAQRRQLAESYRNHMIYGALWFGGGMIVTIGTMMSGSHFVLAWGAIIFGAVDFFRGLDGWMKFR
jgi:hypothetical protein